MEKKSKKKIKKKNKIKDKIRKKLYDLEQIQKNQKTVNNKEQKRQHSTNDRLIIIQRIVHIYLF
jgi:hypothetical protein